MKVACFSILLLLSLIVNSQNCENLKVLGPSKIKSVKTLPVIDERDVMWHRRLWREIDLTENINQYLYFGNLNKKRTCSLYDMLYNQLLKGHIKAYDAINDRFNKELTRQEIINLGGDSIYDNKGELIYKSLSGEDVVKLWVKEDWFFNSKYSKVEVRITGICPVKIEKDNNGLVKGYKQLFWLYFPNIRGFLTNTVAFKKELDSTSVSFDEIFIKRYFDSYIIQKHKGLKQHVINNMLELDVILEKQKTRYYYYKRDAGLWGN